MLRPLALLAAVVFTTGTFGAAHGSEIRPFEVQPRAETEPAKSLEDAADDAEVWLNKAEPSKSIIFGTDKKTGLLVLDLGGRQLDFLPVGRVNNVDLRDGFVTADGNRVLAVASNRRLRASASFCSIQRR